jgi:hypothetical protein
MSELDKYDHPDAELNDEDQEFLNNFDQDAEDRAAIEELEENPEIWETDPTGDDDEPV